MNRAVGVVIVLAAVWNAGQPAWSQSSPSGAGAPLPTAEAGKDTYAQHCAACHGAGGRGDGPVANSLKVAPADLTQLTAKNKGQFPSAKIADIVRNGGALLGHGTEMPAWAKVFGVKGDPAIARARIAGLVRYIESLQEK